MAMTDAEEAFAVYILHLHIYIYIYIVCVFVHVFERTTNALRFLCAQFFSLTGLNIETVAKISLHRTPAHTQKACLQNHFQTAEFPTPKALRYHTVPTEYFSFFFTNIMFTDTFQNIYYNYNWKQRSTNAEKI